jgi:hypothetical protein
MPYAFTVALLATSSVLGAKVRGFRRAERERIKAYWVARDAGMGRAGR